MKMTGKHLSVHMLFSDVNSVFIFSQLRQMVVHWSMHSCCKPTNVLLLEQGSLCRKDWSTLINLLSETLTLMKTH